MSNGKKGKVDIKDIHEIANEPVEIKTTSGRLSNVAASKIAEGAGEFLTNVGITSLGIGGKKVLGSSTKALPSVNNPYRPLVEPPEQKGITRK